MQYTLFVKAPDRKARTAEDVRALLASCARGETKPPARSTARLVAIPRLAGKQWKCWTCVVVWPDHEDVSTAAWAEVLAARLQALVMRVGRSDASGEQFEVESFEPDGARARRTVESPDEEIVALGDRLLGNGRGETFRRAWMRAFQNARSPAHFVLTPVLRVPPKAVLRGAPPQTGVFALAGVRPTATSIDYLSCKLAVPANIVGMCVVGRRVVDHADPVMAMLRRWFDLLASVAGVGGRTTGALSRLAPENGDDPWRMEAIKRTKVSSLAPNWDSSELTASVGQAVVTVSVAHPLAPPRAEIDIDVGGLSLLFDGADGSDATHLGFWLRRDAIDREGTERVRTAVSDSIDVLASSANFLQAFLDAWDWKARSLFLTPYERILGVDPGPPTSRASELPTRRAWCERRLRGVGETVWLGPELRRRVDSLPRPRTVDARLLGDSLRLRTAEKNLDDVVRWLALVAPDAP